MLFHVCSISQSCLIMEPFYLGILGRPHARTWFLRDTPVFKMQEILVYLAVKLNKHNFLLNDSKGILGWIIFMNLFKCD